MRNLKITAIIAISAALVAGCSPAAAPVPAAPLTVAAAPAPAQGGTVNATLTDMLLTVDRSTISAGPVTFVVKNSGLVAHELVLIHTDVAQDKLALNPDEAGKVIETGNLGETGDMSGGESKTFTVTLPAGHYVLMCNMVGHYMSGMHIAFTVN